MPTNRSLVVAIEMLGATANMFAQAATVPVRTLSTPEAELQHPFTRISGLHELSDGRVIVVDAGEKLVALVNLTSRTVTRIGREGAGPGEYSAPNKLLAVRGDTTIVGDLAGRLSKVGPSGLYAGDVAMPALGGRDAAARAMGHTPRRIHLRRDRRSRRTDGPNGHPGAIARNRFRPERCGLHHSNGRRRPAVPPTFPKQVMGT